MIKTPELKPCPFCGNDLCYVRSTGIEIEVYCQNCTALGPMHISSSTEEDVDNKAIAAWNTRAVDPATIREAALREAADVVHKWWFEDGNDLPQELILELIGEKK